LSDGRISSREDVASRLLPGHDGDKGLPCARRLANLSATELMLIAAMAALASIIGGVAGYGTGALMPLVLVPIVGAEPVVPIIAISALFTNTSRAFAFRH
jgi:hypothetical protein